ncbi:conserved exported hypothetical protein [Cupriavidus taiwanensis]|uniref:Lipoprotein n=2 Tax=Cupriavidus taiwanensis TaxID=164546 RepID=A0A375C6E1_9BURK|nr:conserved exported hypothetical protein [Cupriavidus taiwanensis]
MPFAIKPLRIAAAAMSFVVLAACAPDSVRNIEARGFNAYLDSLQAACPNMVVGSSNISEWLRTSGSRDDDNYVYWLDQTSRLYYRRISAAQYRESVSAALGGKSDSRALDCIVRNLPAERPTHPPGGKLL